MAFDSVPDDGDPRGPICPKCARPITKDENRTVMHFEGQATSRPWHSECARPYWDKLSGVLDRLKFGWGG